METKIFSLLKALYNVHWTGNCRSWFLVLPQYPLTHISLSFKALRANWHHKNKTVIYESSPFTSKQRNGMRLGGSPVFQISCLLYGIVQPLMLQSSTEPALSTDQQKHITYSTRKNGELLKTRAWAQTDLHWKTSLFHVTCHVIKQWRCQVSSLKGHYHYLCMEWQFTRTDSSTTDALWLSSATGEQHGNISRSSQKPGLVYTHVNLQLYASSQATCYPTKAQGVTSQSSDRNHTARSCPRHCLPRRNIPFHPPHPQPNQSHWQHSYENEHIFKLLRLQAFIKFHLLEQASPKQHLKTMHTSAIKNKPTTKSPILWTKPGKPPLRDTQLSDPAKSKLSLNYQATEVNLTTFLQASLLSCQDEPERGWTVHLKLY